MYEETIAGMASAKLEDGNVKRVLIQSVVRAQQSY
jgi:hypothetical protein